MVITLDERKIDIILALNRKMWYEWVPLKNKANKWTSFHHYALIGIQSVPFVWECDSITCKNVKRIYLEKFHFEKSTPPVFNKIEFKEIQSNILTEALKHPSQNH